MRQFLRRPNCSRFSRIKARSKRRPSPRTGVATTEEVVVNAPLAENEFDAAPDESDADAVQAASLNRSMQGLARAVSLDPDDKMGL